MAHADPNFVFDDGETALTRAISAASRKPELKDTVIALLQSGADPSLVSVQKGAHPYRATSPFLAVFESFHDEKIRQEYLDLLLAARKRKPPKPELDQKLLEVMHTKLEKFPGTANVQARKALSQFLELIASGADPNLADGTGLTPVAWTVEVGSHALIHSLGGYAAMDLLPYLVARGADLFPKSGQKDWASLLINLQTPDLDLIRYLFERGLNPNSADSEGDTLLMKAVRNDYDSTIELLLHYGPDLGLKNKKGESAVSLAQGKKGISSLLRSAPAAGLPMNEVLGLIKPDFKGLENVTVADLTEWKPLPDRLLALGMAGSPIRHYRAALYLLARDKKALSVIQKFDLQADMDICKRPKPDALVSGGALELKFDQAPFMLDERNRAIGVRLTLHGLNGTGYGADYEKLLAFEVGPQKIAKVFEDYAKDEGYNPVERLVRKFVLVVDQEKANGRNVWLLKGTESRFAKFKETTRKMPVRRFEWKSGSGYTSTAYVPAWKLSDAVGHCD